MKVHIHQWAAYLLQKVRRDDKVARPRVHGQQHQALREACWVEFSRQTAAEKSLPRAVGPKAARESVSSADVVVCDYNHVFVEAVRDSSLTAMGIGLEDTLLVVDEAHNLPDRIRSPIRIDRLDDMDAIWHADFESALHQSLL